MSEQPPAPDIAVVADRDAVADHTARLVEELLLESSAACGEVSLALAGSDTLDAVYRHLAARPVPWGCLQVFFSNEYLLPKGDPGSDFHRAERALLGRMPLRPRQVHRIRGEIEPGRAAIEAEAILRDYLPGKLPSLDLILLGLGPEGRVAGLFPGTPGLREKERLYVPSAPAGIAEPTNISMTLPLINEAKHVVIAASDAEKAPQIAAALAGDRNQPLGRVRPRGQLHWVLGRDAYAAAEVV